MKRFLRFGVPALACAAGLIVGVAVAQEEGGAGGGAAGMGMPAWMTKGKEHESLKKLEGTWDAKVTMFGQPQPPGKATNQLILDGNFLEQRYQGQMGMTPFEGRLILGYDTLDKEWVSIWLDSGGPLFSISRGTEKDGVIAFKTNDPDMSDPNGTRKEGKMTVSLGDKSYTVAMFQGDGTKFLEIVYTKK